MSERHDEALTALADLKRLTSTMELLSVQGTYTVADPLAQLFQVAQAYIVHHANMEERFGPRPPASGTGETDR